MYLESDDRPSDAAIAAANKAMFARAAAKRLQRTLEAQQRRQLAQKAPQGGLGITVKPRPDAGNRGGQKRTWMAFGKTFYLSHEGEGKSVSFRPEAGGKVMVITRGKDWHARKFPIVEARKLWRQLVKDGYTRW